MSEVTLYGRPDCHLCEEARLMIEGLIDGSGGRFELREVNIEGDDELHRSYLERIPVVVVDGAIVSELVPDFQALQMALLHNSSR